MVKVIYVCFMYEYCLCCGCHYLLTNNEYVMKTKKRVQECERERKREWEIYLETQ